MLTVTLPTDTASPPAGIQQLPVPIVDLDRIPSVARGFPWRRPFAVLEWGEPIAFAMTPDDDAFQPSTLRDGFVDAGIAFADCFAREDSIARCAPLDTTAKEAFNILLTVSTLHRGRGVRGGFLLVDGQPPTSCVLYE